MGFRYDGSTIYSADGLKVGRFLGRKGELNLKVEGEVTDVLRFMNSVAEAYEAIHPPARHLDFEFEEGGATTWKGAKKLNERTVKAGGDKIRVHMTDVDPWPSDLHGHVLTRRNTKVDAYTGELFNTRTKKQIGSMAASDLQRLQDGLRKDDWARTKLDARATANAAKDGCG